MLKSACRTRNTIFLLEPIINFHHVNDPNMDSIRLFKIFVFIAVASFSLFLDFRYQRVLKFALSKWGYLF